MKHITKILAMLAIITCLLTGCSNNSNDVALDKVREEASKYKFLSDGRNACQSLTQMLGYYNNETYQRAKEAVKISDNIRVKYFPSVNWQGVEILSIPKQSSITNLLVSNCNDTQIEYLFCIALDGGVYVPTTRWYKANYSIKRDEITDLELICEL